MANGKRIPRHSRTGQAGPGRRGTRRSAEKCRFTDARFPPARTAARDETTTRTWSSSREPVVIRGGQQEMLERATGWIGPRAGCLACLAGAHGVPPKSCSIRRTRDSARASGNSRTRKPHRERRTMIWPWSAIVVTPKNDRGIVFQFDRQDLEVLQDQVEIIVKLPA